MKAGVDYIGVGCGALIMNEKGETLLMKRGENSKNQVGVWTKPGGAVEFGETAEEAIIREVKEELDIDIVLDDFLGYTDHILKDENQHWIAINYSAKIVSGTPRITEPDKTSEIMWFSLEDLPENISKTTTEPIEVYMKRQ